MRPIFEDLSEGVRIMGIRWPGNGAAGDPIAFVAFHHRRSILQLAPHIPAVNRARLVPPRLTLGLPHNLRRVFVFAQADESGLP